MTVTVVADRFELGRVAGKGGMATVHEARDRVSGEIVALKIVEGPFANPRFEREASLLARLSHPGIVRYVAHGRIDHGRMYLAMEWLEGVTLDGQLKTGALGVSDAIALGARVARSLEAAHAAGVIHRDVKPSNIILRGGRATDPILVDFGIARADQASRVMTATGAVVGTPAYMAPEQVRGESRVDARADMFSLGCVLFECLAGYPPFAGEHVVAVLAKILLEPAPRVAAVRRDVPRLVDDLIASLLEKAPDARPPTIARVASTLERISMDDIAPTSELRSGAIGLTEQRLATVLLVRPRLRGVIDVAFADTEEPLSGVTAEGVAEVVAARLGVTMHQLADGALVGMASGDATAARTVRSALALEEELEGAGIAVATGRAVVAGVVPVGEAIDVAARIIAERGARGGVWICDTTREMVEDRFDLFREGKGTRVRREKRRGERTLLGKATPFVGRDREIAMLEATFDECVDEPVARTCIVVAPPGIGKSRLQRELAERVRKAHEDAQLWLAMADPLMEKAPFAFISDLMRRVFGIVEDEALGARREKIARHVRALGIADADRVARRLGEVSGTPFADDKDDALRAARRDPLLLAAQVTDAFVAFVLAKLARKPHLVLLEDVHWADAASVRLLGAVLAHARELPLMVLALARPSVDEVYPKLWEEERCQRIALEPLLKKAAEKLARAVLGEETDVQAIVRRSGGNALFVEELARACAEGKAPSDLPTSVAAVTEARLSALPSDTRRVMRAAAIFGERFWASGVAALVGGAGQRLEEALAFLEEREIVSLSPTSRFGAMEREYVFRHAVVRDVAYEMLTPDDRRLGHALAGEWLSERTDDGALLAHHFEAGGRPNEAARWYVRAAEQALAAQELDALFRHLARAESCGASGAVLGLARLLEADARFWLGENLAAAAAGRAALGLLDEASERWFIALGLTISATGRSGDIRDHFDLIDLLARDTIDEQARRAKWIARARAAVQLAYSEEIDRADTVIERWEDDQAAADPGVLAWIYEALAERGNAAGEPIHPKIIRRGRELRFEMGDRRGALVQFQVELQLLCTLGLYEECDALIDELARAAQGSSPLIDQYIDSSRAILTAIQGDPDPLIASLATFDLREWPRARTNALGLIAATLLANGRLGEARRYAEEAAIVSGAPRGFRSSPIGTLARIEVAEGNVPRALELSEQALDYVKRGAPLFSFAQSYRARVEALDAAGRSEEARDFLQTALDLLHTKTKNVAEFRPRVFAVPDFRFLKELAHERGITSRHSRG